MKHTLIILALITASIQTFAQSPRIKLNQITKDSLTGSVLISSPTDSGMVYSRDLFISYGVDTVLILGGDTLAATSGTISSVLSDGVTITGDGTLGSELTVDTTTYIATKGDLTGYVDLTNAQTVGGAKTFTSALTQSGGDVNFDSGTFFVDEDVNRVGIGTSSPSALLHVDPDPGTSANYMKYDGTRLALEYGVNNIAVGNNAGNSNSGFNNLCFGALAGQKLQSTGYANAFIGVFSGSNDSVSGQYNLGLGYTALYNLTSGNNNVAIGTSLDVLTTGSDNIGIGFTAGRNITSGSDNIYIGSQADASGATVTNEIAIGKGAIGQGSNTVAIGNTSITSIEGQVSFTTYSDARDKKNINDLSDGLNIVKQLRPVKFTWETRDGGRVGVNDIGFIAQEVDGVQFNAKDVDYINIVNYNYVSDKWRITYDKFTPIIVKAIQEQQTIIETQATEIEQLKSQIQLILSEIEQIKNN